MRSAPSGSKLIRMNTIAMSYRPVDGVDVRVAESVYVGESTWPVLSEPANLVAIDLPGFGGSARRDDLLTPAREDHLSSYLGG
jgi:pimeloyl-ACP methyl ester carboxylesterase